MRQRSSECVVVVNLQRPLQQSGGNLLVQPLELPPVEQTRQHRTAPPSLAFCCHYENSVGGLADLTVGVRLHWLWQRARRRASRELGGVDLLLSLKSPWNVAKGIVVISTIHPIVCTRCITHPTLQGALQNVPKIHANLTCLINSLPEKKSRVCLFVIFLAKNNFFFIEKISFHIFRLFF